MSANRLYGLPENSDGVVVQIPDTVVGAIEVMNGLHGIGEARVQSLKNAGYDPAKVQKLVNTLVIFWE